MKWIIQSNIYDEKAIKDLVNILTRYEIEYEFVKVIPFSGGEIIPVPEITGNAIVIGSGTLNKFAVKANLNPAPFTNDDFTHHKCQEMFGDEMLNSDAVYMPYDKIGEFVDPDVEYFIRPSDDGKCFAGTIMMGAKIDEWFSLLKKYEGIDLSGFENVMVCSTKRIVEETRFVIAEGEVLTGSVYKRGDMVHYYEAVDQDVLDYAQAMADIWCPADVFVLDVARTPYGMNIIEINNFNSAGWYHCNVSKIVEKLEMMYPNIIT